MLKYMLGTRISRWYSPKIMFTTHFQNMGEIWLFVGPTSRDLVLDSRNLQHIFIYTTIPTYWRPRTSRTDLPPLICNTEELACVAILPSHHDGSDGEAQDTFYWVQCTCFD